MKRKGKSKKKDFSKYIRKKRTIVKVTTILILGAGIGEGFFTTQMTSIMASAVPSYINFSVETKANQRTYISEAEAELAASMHAGVIITNTPNPSWMQIGYSKQSGILKRCKLDQEDGIMIYRIEIFSDGYQYNYKINASTGEIISYKKESDPDAAAIQEQQNSTSSNTINTENTEKIEDIENTEAAAKNRITYIEKEEARTIAYTHAEEAKENLYLGRCEMAQENGISTYEVEFQSFNGYNYKYKINATTGEIISSQKEQNPHYAAIQANRNGQIGDTIVYIHLGEAEYAATSHAGVTNYKMTNYQLKQEDEMVLYEIELTADHSKYHYKIQAMTGEVISYQKELSTKKNQNDQTENKENGTNTFVINENTKNNTNTFTGKTENTKNNTINFINELDARTIALQHSKAAHGGLIVECELKSKNGIFTYEVEFKLDGFEYKYQINAITAELINYEKEWS